MENASTIIFRLRRGTFLHTVDSVSLAQQQPHEKLVGMLRTMCKARRFEERADELHSHGLVHGPMNRSAF